MPLEVRQIGIRLNVGDEAAPSARVQGGSEGPSAASVSAAERAAIVGECVDAVLAELKMRSER
jgi:hypothetical protein